MNASHGNAGKPVRSRQAAALSGRVETGRRGEDAAAKYLAEQGYAVRHRNWRCRSGELDIVAEKDGVLVFVEVRARRAASRYGTAAESVDARKQRQLHGVAQVYLAANGLEGRLLRFDVIACTLSDPPERIELDHIIGAF
jgi:putative endonuclease